MEKFKDYHELEIYLKQDKVSKCFFPNLNFTAILNGFRTNGWNYLRRMAMTIQIYLVQCTQSCDKQFVGAKERQLRLFAYLFQVDFVSFSSTKYFSSFFAIFACIKNIFVALTY